MMYFFLLVNMKFEIMCKNSDSLLTVKGKLLKEIEAAFFLNLKKIISINDISFSCKKHVISKVLEEKTLETLYEELVLFSFFYIKYSMSYNNN